MLIFPVTKATTNLEQSNVRKHDGAVHLRKVVFSTMSCPPTHSILSSLSLEQLRNWMVSWWKAMHWRYATYQMNLCSPIPRQWAAGEEGPHVVHHASPHPLWVPALSCSLTFHCACSCPPSLWVPSLAKRVLPFAILPNRRTQSKYDFGFVFL